MATSIAQAWERFERWLREHAPRIAAGLGAPATSERIAAVERELGRSLPADWRASLLIHDGEATDVGSIAGLRLNSLDALVADWRAMAGLDEEGDFAPLPSNDTDDFAATLALIKGIEAQAHARLGKRAGGGLAAVRPPASASLSKHRGLRGGHWNRGWVPIASTGSGNSFSLDLDPVEGGRVGQMFFFDHEVGPGPVISQSFTEWLTRYVEDLEQGRVGVGPSGYLVRFDRRRAATWWR
ncbi:MAG: SMI1/KNR4 family protein [Minicystis sp.]